MSSAPDLIITNADIITMDRVLPRARAVAVSDGVITAVGSSADVTALASPGTQVVDLEGGVLCPGFVEPHSHVLIMAMLLAPQLIDVRAFVVPTWAGIAEKISQAVSNTPPGQPILVFGLDTISHDVSMPTKQELDAFTTQHPLVVIAMSAHTLSANSAAFTYSGITTETPDPPGGSFAKDADGSLTGIVDEASAVVMVVRPLMAGVGLDLVSSVRSQAASLSRAGFTTIGELLVQAQDLPLVDAIKQMPDFPIRMRLYEMTNASLTAEFRVGDTDPRVRQTGLKLWVDGTPLEGKSLHKEPFLDTEVTRKMGLIAPCCGSANYTEEQLLTTCRAYAEVGLQFAAHVQGDAAVDRILDVYATVLAERGLIGTDHRWRLEHCGGMSKEQFERAAGLGVTCSMFVQHVYYFGDSYVDDILGQERGSHWMSLRSAIDSGIRMSLHNDGYFTPPEPIASIQTAATRVAKSGREMGVDECITVDEALRAVTIDAAWHLFSEHEVGSIEVGKLADFAELTADPYSVKAADLNDKVVVTATWLNGKKVDLESLT